MNVGLFRKKSIERVSSPEQLDTYIRVANPGVWMVLIAIAILLIGACVWGVVGHLDTTVPAVAVSENGAVTIYVKEANAPSVQEGMPVHMGNMDWTVTDITATPVVVDSNFSDYALHIGNFQKGEWVYAFKTNAQLPKGVYSAEIVVESVSPMSFVMN